MKYFFKSLLYHKISGKYLFLFVFLLLFFNLNIYAKSQNIQRIVSLAPHITEIIFRLGAENLLVGRTTYCNYPKSAESIATVGAYLNIDYEKIIFLNPDLIFQFPNQQNRMKLEQLGLQVEEIPNESIEDILTSIEKVGRILNKVSQAKKVISGIQDTMDMVSSVKFSSPLSAMLIVGRQLGSVEKLHIAGKNTYLNQIWELCGGVNAFEEVPLRYFSVNREDLFKRSIDVIIEFHPDWDLGDKQLKNEQKVWQVLDQIPAVKEGNIFIFQDDFYLIPGPRITKIALNFSKIVGQLAHD